MVSLKRARALALSLPEATEQDHHAMSSFRVRGRIFATVPDAEHIRVMLSEEEITAAVTENPACCGALYSGLATCLCRRHPQGDKRRPSPRLPRRGVVPEGAEEPGPRVRQPVEEFRDLTDRATLGADETEQCA